MKKLILIFVLLLVGQISFSQTTVRYVILKADDLIDAGGSAGPGRISPAWRQFNQMVVNMDIKANLGINGSQCNYSGSGSFWTEVNNLLATGRFELWNHGFVHTPTPSNPLSNIFDNQNLVQARTGATMIAYGAPENRYDASTYSALNSIADLEYIMFANSASTSKIVWARDLNIESPTFVPNYQNFISNYPSAIQTASSNGRDYLCLQVHPNNHTPEGGSRQTNLIQIIEFLKAEGLIFVTIAQYKALHGGTPPPPPSCGTTVNWSNTAFTNQTGSFTTEFDVVPGGANMDGVVGLSNGAASAFTSLACAVQFATDGTIKARNGSAYAAATAVNYAAGTSYRIKMEVNIANKTYNIYATPAGGSQQTLGTGYAFRTEQNAVTQLNNRAINTLSCSLAVSNFTVVAGTATIPAAPTGLSATKGNAQVSLNWTASAGATSYTVKRSTTSGSGYTNVATGITGTSYTNTGLTNGTTYYYVVSATNGAGTSVNSSQVSVTPTNVVIDESFVSSAANFTVVRGGVWTVTGGKYVLTSAATTGIANGNISVHNTSVSGVYTLSADASATSNTSSPWDDFSILFNYQDVNNYYFVSLNEGNDANTSGIFKISGGVVTQLADITALITGGTTYNVRIVRNGSAITVSRNGTQIATATDATFTSGKVGFGTLNNGASFDNLVVSTGTTGPLGTLASSNSGSSLLSLEGLTNPQTKDLSSNLSVYPNPATGKFSIEISDKEMLNGRLTVTDVLGRVVIKNKQLEGNKLIDIDISKEPRGLYLMIIEKDDKLIQSKLLKE